MQRSNVHPVTTTPILVIAEKGQKPDGFARFLAAKRTNVGAASVPIRMLCDQDIKLDQIFPTKNELDLLSGLIRLKDAHRTGDKLVLRDAYFKLWPHIVNDPNVPEAGKERSAFADIYAQCSEQSELWYPRIASQVTSGARIVMWFSDRYKTFLPGIFCPDWKTAAFVHSFFGRIRSCPHCNALFIPLKSDMLYCLPAHREAHRVARWRANKKEKKHGTKKR